MKVIDPTKDEVVREIRPHGTEEVERRLARAHAAFQEGRRDSFGERAVRMRRAAEILRERKDELARLMAQEMGKPVREGRSEAEKCAWVCEYYADHAERFLTDEPIDTDARKSFVAFEPLGLVLAIMPWNFPFWQVFRFAAPALMAGNAAVLKHAPNVPGCAAAIEEVLAEAGLREGLFTSLLVDVDAVERIIGDPRVMAVTLTGSTRAGRAVASQAGHALKKTVLELGGSDPSLILADAELEAAAEACAKSRLLNSGQSCIAAKRFVVVESVRERFVELLVRNMRAARVGDPLDEETDIGPMARMDLRDTLHEQVTRSVEQGAQCLLGGEIPDRPGAWYPPTVLTGVRPGMPAFDEELFGPVAAVVTAEDEEQAILLANRSDYGLGASVYTKDTARGEEIAARRLQAGACFVNGLVRSDPRVPFGGIKQSGYGRELGAFGIREFVNIKTVWVD